MKNKEEKYPTLEEIKAQMPEVAAGILRHTDEKGIHRFSLIPTVGESAGGVDGLILMFHWKIPQA